MSSKTIFYSKNDLQEIENNVSVLEQEATKKKPNKINDVFFIKEIV